jgi:hypothetical protein
MTQKLTVREVYALSLQNPSVKDVSKLPLCERCGQPWDLGSCSMSCFDLIFAQTAAAKRGKRKVKRLSYAQLLARTTK